MSAKLKGGLAMSLYEWLTILLYALAVIVAVIALVLEELRHRGKKKD